MFEKYLESKDFYTLADIQHVRTWNYELPTLTEISRFTSREHWNESKNFTQAFLEKYPIMKHISLENIAIVGGCVIDILTKKQPNDIDLFIINNQEFDENDNFVENRVKKFMKEVNDYMEMENLRYKKCIENDLNFIGKTYKLDDFLAKRYKGVITITIPGIDESIQFVLKVFKNLDQLFDKIDIGSTCVAYYQDEVIFNNLGKFCFENLAFPLPQNLEKATAKRVLKYFNKGFDVILPNLDINKVPTRHLRLGSSEILDFKDVNVYFESIEKNQIFVTSIKISNEKVKSFDNSIIDGYNKSKTIGGIAVHHNIKQIVKGKQNFVFEGCSKYIDDVFLEFPVITQRMIIKTYDTVFQNICDKTTINFSYLEDFFSKKTSEILKIIAESYLKKEINKMFDVDDHLKKEFRKLIDEQIFELSILIKDISLNKAKSFDFKEKFIDKKDWYGEYFLE